MRRQLQCLYLTTFSVSEYTEQLQITKQNKTQALKKWTKALTSTLKKDIQVTNKHM